MDIVEKVKHGVVNGDPSIDLARKIFLSYQTKVFQGREDIEYEIKNRIKSNFAIPFTSIQVAGSAKTGFSFFKHTLFTEGKSDLDVSIICLDLYIQFLEIAHKRTRGFRDLTVFPSYKGRQTDRQFLDGIRIGYLNPFFMPDCEEKRGWLDFFRNLSNDYYRIFKSVNAGIYSSEYFFESKQSECIEEFKGKVGSYDSLPSKI